jgi:hypothetical protein
MFVWGEVLETNAVAITKLTELLRAAIYTDRIINDGTAWGDTGHSRDPMKAKSNLLLN